MTTRAEQMRAAFYGEEVQFEPIEQSEKSKLYWKELRERKERKHVNAEEAYQYIIERGTELCKRRGQEFVIDKYNKSLLINLAYYFGRDDRFDGDLNKGILLQGNFGVGKSFPFICAAGMFSPVAFEQDMMKSSNQLINLFQQDGADGVVKFQSGVFCLDEICEVHDANNFGNKVNIVQQLIEIRYDLFIRKGTVTHGTTNFLNGDIIEQHFGGRVRSRMREMFNVFMIQGVDRRDK